jgi:2-methylisocitrate lyase-like PEP mutase family enzyme
MPNPTLRQTFESSGFVPAPSVYGITSALIADQMGFKALDVSGYGFDASRMGLP